MFHREIILNKKVLYNLYREWYSLFCNEIPALPNQVMVEIGSGGGFLKQIEPSITCSDIIELPTNDLTFSALDMPFSDDSVGGIFMVDTLHHIPDINLFLNEARRVLAQSGKIVMIEPSNTLWGRFIYKNFHHEPFYPDGGWSIPLSGPLSGANGALPWIVFERDYEIFKKKFPELEIENIEYINPLTYLFSGGVSHRQFAPSFLFPGIRLLDRILPKISPQLSMFMLVKVVKSN
jgi:SAM-dependent methyltransferase